MMTHPATTCVRATCLLVVGLLPAWLALAEEAPAAPPAADQTAAAPVPPAGDKPVTAELPKVTVKFEKTEIADAVLKLHEMTGYDFVVGRGVQGQVTASFTDQPVDKVLRTISLALGLNYERRDRLFVIKAKTAPDALAGPLEGAGALLPGETPDKPLQLAGDAPAPLAGQPDAATATPGGAVTGRGGRTQASIPLTSGNARTMAALLGGAWVDGQGNVHTQEEMRAAMQAQQWQQQQQPWANQNPTWADPGWGTGHYQPGTQIGPNGVLTLPNGTVIYPNGTVAYPNGTIAYPNGTVVSPNGVLPGAVWPNGVRPNGPFLPNQTTAGQPTVQGTVAGVPFALGPNGLQAAPTINLGGLGQVQIPLNLGGNQQGVGIGQGVTGQPGTPGLVLGNPQFGQTGNPNIWWNNLGPQVHIGTPPVNMTPGWVPSGWKQTPPAGMVNLRPSQNSVGTPVMSPKGLSAVDPKDPNAANAPQN